jgi:sugar phosphate permease
MGRSDRPTIIRYIVLGLATLVAVMLYLDRWCLGFVAQDIRNQFRLEQWEVDWLQGAFFLTYAFGQIPCGWLSDRFGQRSMLTLFLLTWSVLTGMMGLATGFAALLVLRLGCGLFEAGAYPACAGIIRRWAPARQRGLASSIVSIGGRIGGAIAPPVTVYLMFAFTPVVAPPFVTAADLIDPRGLAEQLVSPTVAPPRSFARVATERIASMLTPTERDFLTGVAHRPATAVAADDSERVREMVNHLLRRPDLFAAHDLTPYAAKIPPQAKGDPPPTDAEERVVVYRNRLLLEVAMADRGKLPNLLCKYHGWGWQSTLMVFGVSGIMLALVFAAFFRNNPRQHPLVNTAEVELIEGHGANKPATDAVSATPARELWLGIVTSRSLWCSAVVQIGTNFGWLFLGTKLAEYLEHVYQVPKVEQAWMVFLPFFLSVPMTIVGGWWTDQMTRRWGPRLGRMVPLAATRFIAAAAFLICLKLAAPWPVTLAICVMAVASDAGLPAIWAYNLDVGGRDVGMVLGWGNMWGNLGAFVSPRLLGLIQERFDWDGVFVTCAIVYAVIGFASLGIDATKPIVARRADTMP